MPVTQEPRRQETGDRRSDPEAWTSNPGLGLAGISHESALGVDEGSGSGRNVVFSMIDEPFAPDSRHSSHPDPPGEVPPGAYRSVGHKKLPLPAPVSGRGAGGVPF